MSSPQGPVLQGQVVYEDHRGGFWNKVGTVLAGAGHVLASALPYVAQAASIYASSLGNFSGGGNYSGRSSWDTPVQTSSRSQRIPMPEPIQPRSLPNYRKEPIVRNALSRLEQQQSRWKTPAPDWAGMQARSKQVLDEIASSRGLPSYENFHQMNGIAYDSQPRQSALGIERFTQPSRQSPDFIHEDYGQIAHNLSHAQRYVPTDLRLRQMQTRATGTRPADESPALHQMIMRSNEARDRISKQTETTPSLPDSIHKGTNVTELVKQGHVPTDEQLKQLLHTLDLQRSGARDPFSKRQAAIAEQWMKQKLARNMISGPDAILNSDGYVIIGSQAYGSFEAMTKALADIEHFEATEKHLPGLNYPVNPKLPKQAYPDVTNMIRKELRAMIPIVQREAEKGFWQGTKPLFEKMFKNNGPWDMQVGHGLPGQVIVRNQSGEVVPDNDEPGRYETTDQFAVLNGEVHRAGYISNYVFGQAAAAAGIPKDVATAIAQAIAIKDGIQKGRLVLDNPDDQRAIRDGWEDWSENPLK